MTTFEIVYQDRALNTRKIQLEAPSWSDIIPMAFATKKAEEKLLTIEASDRKEEEND